MGFSRSRARYLPVENPILLYFPARLSTIYSARKADGPGSAYVFSSRGASRALDEVHQN